MKTVAAVICALLATAGVAFAHGSAAGGPVMVGGGSSTRSGLAVFSARPAPWVTENDNRRHRKPVTYPSVYPMYVWDPKICRPPQFLLAPVGVVGLNGAYPCGLDDNFVSSTYGPIPFWLPPAFMW